MIAFLALLTIGAIGLCVNLIRVAILLLTNDRPRV